MKKRIYTILTLLVAATLLVAGCSDDIETEPGVDPGRAIGFSCGDAESRAEEATAANISSFRVWAVMAKASGGYVDDFMDEQPVKKNGSGVWTYSPIRYMPIDGSTVDFFAYSPANATVSDFTISGATHDQISLDYDVTTDPAAQHDFMVAAALEEVSAPISLMFRHVLSSVRIEARGATPGYAFRVNEVKLLNIYRRGTLTGTTSASPKTTTWTWGSLSTKTSYTIAQNGPVDLATYFTPISDPAVGPLMILPQTVEKGGAVTDISQVGTASYIAVRYDVFDSMSSLVAKDATSYFVLGDPDDISNPNAGFPFKMNGKYVFRIDLKYP